MHIHSRRCRRFLWTGPSLTRVLASGHQNGLTHDASRTRPRDMRFQNPAGLSCGSTPTTASTVWVGASAINVYTMPRLDQVRER